MGIGEHEKKIELVKLQRKFKNKKGGGASYLHVEMITNQHI